MRSRHGLWRRQRGFNLLELILSVAVLGILSAGMFGFVGSSVEGYVDSRDREALQSQARFVVERLGRELRHAVPNSIAIINDNNSESTNNVGSCLIYTPIKYAGVYDQFLDNPARVDLALSSQASGWEASVIGHKMVFLPLKRADLFSQSSAINAQNSFEITGSVKKNQLMLSKNPSATWPVASLSKRLYIYKHSVAFCFKGANLIRRVIVADGTTKEEMILAKNVLPESQFTVFSASLSQTNLINVYYRFGRGDETSVYNQQIQVTNAP